MLSRLKTTRGGKAVAPVVDIFPQITMGHHDDARIAEEMRLLKSLGFERVYFVLCNPGYPMFSNPVLALHPPDLPGLENHSFRSIASLGDPNFAYVHHCRRLGMEAYAILKPYEGGGGVTVPHGAQLSWNTPRVPDVGGDRVGFDNLLGRRPELRVKRKPDPDYERLMAQPVEKIIAQFCVEDIPDAESAKTPGESVSVQVKFHLFISADNGAYSRYEKPLSVSETVAPERVIDPNGFPIFVERKQCRSFVLTGFSFSPDVRYFALVVECGSKLHTIPQSMVGLHSAEGPLPSTVSTHIRHGGNPVQAARPPGERIWGMEQHPRVEESFAAAIAGLSEWGFEHEWHGAGFWGPGWSSSCAFGIARGKLQWMKGTPCEAYPEVREYWLDWVRKCIDMGFDGVDLRLQNHSGMVSDYVNYGYNEPIIEAYQTKYGVDILRDEADPLKVMAVRGDFFTRFVEQASVLLHQAGRKLQIHLRNCHEKPRLSTEFNELGFWAMPKIWLEQWRHLVDLADEITLKDYHFNRYDPTVAIDIKRYARSQGKRVWVHCYLSQGRELNAQFFNRVESDENVNGILLYEVSHAERGDVNFGLIEQCGPVGFHQPNERILRTIMKQCGFGELAGKAGAREIEIQRKGVSVL
ncbi:hypothetical protein [Rariglobus hedericola]|uniref:Glycosyl hydrolase-like 10 domain-containing protein n=1 Tax=Rariglobus hedericola TaxID=2597822 RepID=A0A556QPH7_9BACT|nr:hypothetical protein [Rariglobus hedericola]TSJ78541.1 hypothetical protein FPL22_04370 [Rariglobus hedericola]